MGMFSIVQIQTNIQASTLSISTEDKSVILYYKSANVGKRLLVSYSLVLCSLIQSAKNPVKKIMLTY